MPFDVDDAAIRRAEARLGTRLPPEYTAELRFSNGGELELLDEIWFLHPVFDDRDERRLKRTCCDVVHETNEARSWNLFPSEGVSIADNGAGDHLLFLPKAGDPSQLSSSVYCWRHDTGQVEPAIDIFPARGRPSRGSTNRRA